ncbi:High mobility group b protein [Thalictrum thalictroides]|uniref:High mobility group b protein n=1 Tax=Thalictrum thalictroides TaxID=46969 RepID=A0A7J6WYB9_THATH|nr:High mobility group b protein [Thalictrum thalictroides]
MVNSKKSHSVSAKKVQKTGNKKEMLKPNSPEKMKRVTRSSSSRVLSEKKKKPISPKKSKAKASKKKTMKEDSNKPKKPPTAFFFFLEEFRKDYQEQNPAITSMRDVGKAGGEKWNSMIFEEKVKYYDMATEKRAEFDKAMAEYEKEKESGVDQDDLEDSEFDEY